MAYVSKSLNQLRTQRPQQVGANISGPQAAGGSTTQKTPAEFTQTQSSTAGTEALYNANKGSGGDAVATAVKQRSATDRSNIQNNLNAQQDDYRKQYEGGYKKFDPAAYGKGYNEFADPKKVAALQSQLDQKAVVNPDFSYQGTGQTGASQATSSGDYTQLLQQGTSRPITSGMAALDQAFLRSSPSAYGSMLDTVNNDQGMLGNAIKEANTNLGKNISDTNTAGVAKERLAAQNFLQKRLDANKRNAGADGRYRADEAESMNNIARLLGQSGGYQAYLADQPLQRQAPAVAQPKKAEPVAPKAASFKKDGPSEGVVRSRGIDYMRDMEDAMGDRDWLEKMRKDKAEKNSNSTTGRSGGSSRSERSFN